MYQIKPTEDETIKEIWVNDKIVGGLVRRRKREWTSIIGDVEVTRSTRKKAVDATVSRIVMQRAGWPI